MSTRPRAKSTASTAPPSPDPNTRPAISSPLNPSPHSSPNMSSNNITPTNRPYPLPSAPSLPAQSLTRGRPRGPSIATVRAPSVSPPGATALTRVSSAPGMGANNLGTLSPHYAQSQSLSSSLTALPLHRSRSQSINVATLSHSFRSRFGLRSETPEGGAPRRWWGKREEEEEEGGEKRPWREEVPRRRGSVPEEQTRAWEHTKLRVEEALRSVASYGAEAAHETVRIGVELLEFAPVLGLEQAARVLLSIWEAVQLVESNRMCCLRLTERCADILISVKEEVETAGPAVAAELHEPMEKLQDAFGSVHRLLLKLIHRPFLKRYLKREEILREIVGCDSMLSDALDMFGVSVNIRILKVIQANEARRQADAQALYDSIRASAGLAPHPSAQALSFDQPHPTQAQLQTPPSDSLLLSPASTETALAPPSLSSTPTPTPPFTPGIPTPSEVSGSPLAHYHSHLAPAPSANEIRRALEELKRREDEQDALFDAQDLRTLMRRALAVKSEVEMIGVLQVARDEMPEAIKTLQRALEREVEAEREREERESEVGSVELGVPVPFAVGAGGGEEGEEGVRGVRERTSMASMASTRTRAGGGARRDTLDREFMEGGLEALQKLSKGEELSLPSWTITRYEVDREEKIGIGYFSDVYRGRWRGHAVAIKVLAETTTRETFVREVNIWKTLRHPNVTTLLGASSTTSDPPWFLVSPYYGNGSLARYLARLGGGEGEGRWWEKVDLVKCVHEIARGMEYLHGQGVLHGDLKASNVLVDDELQCVIADFGQSEMKSEYFRVSGELPPHGTLRWQAPELMEGHSHLAAEMDVYAFAVCCAEILDKGRTPWPMADAISIRHMVIDKHQRPPLNTGPPLPAELVRLIEQCWNQDPSMRPSFPWIAAQIKEMRVKAGSTDIEPHLSPPLLWAEEWARHHVSPSMRPNVPLPPESQEEEHSGSLPTSETDDSYHTADPHSLHPSEEEYSIVEQPPSTRATIGSTTSSSSVSGADQSIPYTRGFESPMPDDAQQADVLNERRYRMLLQHPFHASLKLPLWSPGPVSLGDVGYLKKPEGSFVTLFNAFDPVVSSGGRLQNMANIHGYGKVTRGKALERQDKRTVFQRRLDAFKESLRKNSNGSSPSVVRRYPYPLQAGHKAAYICTEQTVYRYIENLDAPKKWFMGNVDTIMAKYASEHRFQKEDLLLIIGTLEAPDYGLFISHRHPDGQVHFDVFSSAKTGRPWGMFSFDDEVLSASGSAGPSYHEQLPGGPRYAEKVSDVKRSNSRNDSVLLARLRFKPDVAEPTSL